MWNHLPCCSHICVTFHTHTHTTKRPNRLAARSISVLNGFAYLRACMQVCPETPNRSHNSANAVRNLDGLSVRAHVSVRNRGMIGRVCLSHAFRPYATTLHTLRNSTNRNNREPGSSSNRRRWWWRCRRFRCVAHRTRTARDGDDCLAYRFSAPRACADVQTWRRLPCQYVWALGCCFCCWPGEGGWFGVTRLQLRSHDCGACVRLFLRRNLARGSSVW